MNPSVKKFVIGGSTMLMASSLLIGCASKEPPAPAPVVEQTAPVDKPGVAEEKAVVVTAKVQAVNKKTRTVTLKFPNGKTSKVKCGPDVQNFPQIKVGDDVTIEFLETVELFVAAPGDQKPADGQVAAVKRAPKGKKPGGTFVNAVEHTATVTAIDYATRKVTLQTPEGKVTTITAGPQVKRLNEVKQGDTVVARYLEAVSIKVTSPEKAPAKK